MNPESASHSMKTVFEGSEKQQREQITRFCSGE